MDMMRKLLKSHGGIICEQPCVTDEDLNHSS